MSKYCYRLRTFAIVIAGFLIGMVSVAIAITAPQSATEFTQNINQHYLDSLPFNNKADFQAAQKGFIGKPTPLTILSKNDEVVWDMSQFSKFESLAAPVPPTVNPSLWRQARLNTIYGLFKVTDHIYQVRGYDLSVMSVIEGKTGYIIVDPLTTEQTAKAAMQLVFQYLPKKPIKAVIYTHSHIDHFGGVKGVVTAEAVKKSQVKIIAPQGFMDAAISENVMAGNVMGRRATYMYGSLLDKSPYGQVGAGLGKTTPLGTTTIISPTMIISKTPTNVTIDGVQFIFQYTPNTEAPAEMNFYLPQFHALCMAENAVHTLHNLYTLRGAKVRNAQNWVSYLNQTLQLFGQKAEVEFASHHWPTWGQQNIVNFLEKQRDTYKYIHDQTLRLANEGYTMNQIAEMVHLPKSLADQWYNRSYYGTVNHNVKAVYQRYLGWYDGNPANLHPLPEVAASKKYVEYMGGANAILQKAKKDYAAGEYRWVAEVLNKLVFAEPNNQTAKNLLADTYDQLAYQAESGPWRNVYLTAAMELRYGVNRNLFALKTSSPDILRSMPLNLFYDYLAIHLNGPKAANQQIIINWKFPDVKQEYSTIVKNAVLNYQLTPVQNADAVITIPRSVLDDIILGKLTVKKACEQNNLQIAGDVSKVQQFFSLLDKFSFWFNIVTPQVGSP